MPALAMMAVMLCLIGLALNAFFLRRLRQNFPAVWESLGRPTLIANNSPRNSLSTLRYILTAEFRELPDSNFIRYCEFVRAFNILYLVIFGILILVNVVGALLH
jgi:hypothetical protein